MDTRHQHAGMTEGEMDSCSRVSGMPKEKSLVGTVHLAWAPSEVPNFKVKANNQNRASISLAPWIMLTMRRLSFKAYKKSGRVRQGNCEGFLEVQVVPGPFVDFLPKQNIVS